MLFHIETINSKRKNAEIKYTVLQNARKPVSKTPLEEKETACPVISLHAYSVILGVESPLNDVSD